MVINKNLNSQPEQKFFLNLINLMKRGSFLQAQIEAIKLLKKYSNSHNLHNLLGLCFVNQNKINDAIICYKSAIKIKNNFPEAHNNLGIAFKNNGKVKDAIHSYNKAIKYKPNFAEAYNNLGLVMMDQGKIGQAKKYFKKSIKINPNFAYAHRHLSIVTKYTTKNPHILEMQGLISNLKILDKQKMHLAFGLGKAYEDIKSYDKAFECFDLGNKLRRKEIVYDIKNDIVFFETLKKFFNKDLISKLKKSGTRDKTPIFIVGMFRSGTTLVEQILSSHSKVFGGGESKTLTQIVSHFISGDFSNLNRKVFNDIGNAYVGTARKFQPKYKHITDKQPINFKWIGIIKAAIPNAKIIHCVRNPIDNCLSIYKNYFDFKINPYAYNLDELAEYYKIYENLMQHWHSMFPKFIYEVSYEKLIKNQKRETEKLLDFCNLKWENKCMQFYKNKRNVSTASTMQVRRPIYKDSIAAWKRYEKYLSILINKFS